METDVLVIGAGPAGSVAGAMLAQRGHKVLTLEAGTFPRFQIGESLLPRCNDVLEQAGLLEAVVARGYQPKNAALFLKGTERERFSFSEVFPGQRTQTFQVPRADFDQTLATGARQKGVDVRFSHKVESVEFGPQGAAVRAVDLEGRRDLSIQAKFVLDCSGYGRVLPRLLKLEKTPSLEPRLALFTWVEGDVRPPGAEEGDIWVCIHPNGSWAWVIPFSNGRTSVGLVMERSVYESVEGCDRDRLFQLLHQDPNLHARLARATPVLQTSKLEAWSASVERLHGPGWALTGNAAEFLDPVFSSGVTVALESASRAALLVDQQLKGQSVNWEKDFEAVVQKAVGVFRVFVQTWYSGELPRLLLHAQKAPPIKRAITAILGGYVLDPENPFVRDPRGTMSALLKLA